ncbi:nucleoside hydrolase-like domain-containing protein [Stieleria neptunia]|nr:nucleoside hydrolase-like domain-containing protein [Stieleria neptunia]
MNQLKQTIFLLLIGICYFALAMPAVAQIKAPPTSGKHRIVLLTDIGGDRDDEQSFTRFMMYADQYDIEGLIATSIRIFPKEKHRPTDGEPQPQHLVKWIKAYSEVRGNLLKHSEGWPEPEHLLTLIRKGVKTGRDAPFNIRTGKAGKGSGHYPLDQLIGADKDNGATRLIIDAVDHDDPRPVWVPIWGGSVELAQALWRVRNDRSDEEVKEFVSKLRVYAWGHQDATGLWIQENFPDLVYLVSTGGVIYSAPPELHSAQWLNEHVRFNHGALGTICPLRHGKLGGADTETYLGLIPNGLSNMEHPDWGGWGGRLRKAKGSEKQWIDVPSNILPNRLGHTISRWAPHFQNDYQARMDWCVKEFAEANHPPSPVLNGDKSLCAIEVTAKPGEHVMLDATGTTDIDGDSLSYRWQTYPEAGSYQGQVEIENMDQATTKCVVPKDAAGKTVHVLLVVSDDGTPTLTRYRRLVVTCQ